VTLDEARFELLKHAGRLVTVEIAAGEASLSGYGELRHLGRDRGRMAVDVSEPPTLRAWAGQARRRQADAAEFAVGGLHLPLNEVTGVRRGRRGRGSSSRSAG
jgi:hypothetical protein